MTGIPNQVLSNMLDTPGIRFAALMSPSGAVLAEEGIPVNPELVHSARSIASSLQQALQAGDLQDLLLELSNGPVLFTPQGENTLVAGFDEVNNLGRVRFAVKRAINRL